MIGSLLGLAACVGILVASNGKPIADWYIQPSVYLAIAVPVVNLLLTFSLAEGVDIAWWRRAQQSGTTVGDLHRLWSVGKSVKNALLAGRNTNLVAVACVLATVAQINSPLLQRATRVIEQSRETATSVRLTAAAVLPQTYYSGYVSGRAYSPTMFTSHFASVVSSFYTNTSIAAPKDNGCVGTCKSRMAALGLAVNCSTYSMAFNLNAGAGQAAGTYNVSADPAVNGTDVFYSDIRWTVGMTSMTISTLFKDTHECDGTLSGQRCTISPATVEYAVIIDSNASTISIDPATRVWDDNVLNKTNITDTTIDGPKPFAGYYLALLNRYNSSAHMRWAGAVGYEIISTGVTATQYADLSTDNALYAGQNCTVGWKNPMEDILTGARELMFRTSLAIPSYNASFASTQTSQATQVQKRAVFDSNYAYLGGAVAVTIIALLSVTCVFKGYSELGRSISLSPIEIAKAFNAPLLRGSSDSNMPVDKLIKDIGTQSVRYGAVQADEGEMSGARLVGPWKDGGLGVGVHEVGTAGGRIRLCMADEDLVAEPRQGQTFVG